MNLPFVFRLAWRESRAARRRLGLLVGSVAAGVAALVAINGFTDNLRTSVGAQAKALLGADLNISGRKPFPERIESWADSMLAADSAGGGAKARVTAFAAMAFVPRTTGVRLVQVRAVGPGYPFYGEITTSPADRWRALGEGGKVLVDPTLLPALGAEIGDTLSLGNSRFVIDATVNNIPGDVGVASAFGPRIFIADRDLAATGLVQFGSRVDYDLYLKLGDPAKAQGIAQKYSLPFRDLRYRVRTVEDDRQDLTDTLTRLGNYLGLVALVALLLGGLGVASATHLFIRQKLPTIAVLRCLGATAAQVFLAYLAQALAMGLLGSLVGAGLGVAIQQVLPRLVADLLPVDVTIAASPMALIVGISLGIWVAAVFALLPLLGVRRISPLATLRRTDEPAPGRRDPLTWLAFGLLAASVVGLAAVQVRNLEDGLYFAGGVGAVVLVLWLASLGLIKGLRRYFPTKLPYLWRQGLANLYRPANQTGTVILALGFGAFLLATLFLVQYNLLREFRVGGALGGRPNLMFFDIQKSQVAGVETILAEGGHPGTAPVPIVAMRIHSLKGALVRPPGTAIDTTEDEGDTAPPDSTRASGSGQGGPRRPGGWAVRREYRSTYRDTLTDSETLVSGEWWTGPRGDGPGRVSLDRDVADELQVVVGDDIVWDVQGALIPTRVASLREIDWGRFQTNFYAVFEPGLLEQAPQMAVVLARADSAADRGRLQRQIAERYPNVSAFDLSQVQQAIEGVLDKATLAVRFLALFSLAAGTIVLIGAVTTARLQRLREGVLLKTLGATRRQVLRILVTEYVALGVAAALVAIVLSSGAGWALAKFVFEARFDLPVVSLSGLTALLIGLTLVVGLWSSAEVLKRPPLEILRGE